MRRPDIMALAPHPRSRRRAKRRGQAMIEYSLINALLVLALMVGISLRVVPSPLPGGKMNVLEVMLWAYHTYYDGIYLVLNSPYP